MLSPLPSELTLVGRSRATEALRGEIQFAARTDAKVLVTAETGVGKDLVARLIHQASRRRLAPMATINCAGLPEALLESELFGHMRGSFTDAHRDKPGIFESAANGTVFLDEVGEMSPRMQVVLLRFLETGEIQPVGSDRIHTRVDVRIIAATNRVLLDEVGSGRFREDLYYRLNVLHLRVPPVRERRQDLPLLLEHFLKLFAVQYGTEVPRLSNEALEMCLQYDWPGNIRELKNVLERLVVLRRAGCVEREDIPVELLKSEPSAPATAQPAAPPVADRLFQEIVEEGKSFWSTAYAPFMTRDVTREDLRRLVTMGLKRAGGDYRALTRLFNMPEDDTHRLIAVLRKYQCHVPVQGLRPTHPAKIRASSPIAV